MISLTLTPLYPGADIEAARLGEIEVGRLSTRGGKFSWMFHLPNARGNRSTLWHGAKTREAAVADLMTATTSWVQKAGLVK